jgi:membrane associated rhomboid family serine protease
MTFAPVGIRCPDHANVSGAKSAPTRTIQNVRRTTRSVVAPATMALVAINVVVYMITAAQGGGINLPGGKLFSNWALQGLAVSNGDWWRLVTAMFLHGSLLHLAFNMLALYWLGTIIEQALGTRRFLLVYFVSGLAGSAGALWFSSAFAVTVGASGAIFGLIGALLILEYLSTGSLMGQAMVLIVVNLALTFAVPNISIGGHLGGLAGGIIATFALMRYPARPQRTVGIAIAVGVGVASVAVAYVRVRGYIV